jgi:GMP synthase (glutamine-hydrolysing)
MRVAVVENSPLAPVGLLGAALERRGARLEILPGPDLSAHRAALDQAGFLVTLGSPKAVYDGDDWIRWQVAYLGQAVAQGRAVLGICFGAQLLAAAIGGSVEATGTLHAGWGEMCDAAAPVWRGPWLRWHGDHVRLPPEAEVLARAAAASPCHCRPEAAPVEQCRFCGVQPGSADQGGMRDEQARTGRTQGQVHGGGSQRGLYSPPAVAGGRGCRQQGAALDHRRMDRRAAAAEEARRTHAVTTVWPGPVVAVPGPVFTGAAPFG